MPLTLSLFETTLGWCGLLSGEGRIHGSLLPEETPERVRDYFRRRHPDALEGPPETSIEPAIDRVRGLIEGSDDDLCDLDLDMSAVSPFEESVYRIARQIRPGQTTTYGEIARQLGGVLDSQAVGRALGRNPFAPIVPCHRVVAAGQKLGGFSATGGRSLKIRMLENERRWSSDDLFGRGGGK